MTCDDEGGSPTMAEFDAGSIKSTADVDLAKFKKGLKDAEKLGEAFEKSTWKGKLDLDDDEFDRKLTAAEGRIAAMTGGSVQLDLAGNADEKIDAVHRSLTTITGQRWDIDLGLSGDTEARTQIESLERSVRDLDGKSVGIPVELRGYAEAMAQFAALEAAAGSLALAAPTINVNLTGDAEVLASLGALTAAAEALALLSPTITPDVNIGPASAQLAALRAQLAALQSTNANASVGMRGGGQVMAIIGLILGGLGAIGYAGPAAAAALAAIPQALVGAGTLVGALMGGLSGIGAAYKEMGKQDTASAGASTAAARQRESAANQVKSATRGLQQAHEQASRSAITSEWSVADAARQAGDARVQSAERIRMADRALADAREAAGQRVADSMRSEQRAAESLQRAQENLTKAWRTGREELEDLQLALEGGALSQERAAIGLQRARQRLAEGIAKGVTGLDRAELELDVREAEYGIKTAAERMGDLNEQQRTFAREGVAGSAAVKSAREQVRSAEQAYGDTVRARQQAERDGSKQIQAAEEQLRAAQVEGRKAVAAADRAYSRAVLQSRWQQADAAAAVTAAEDQLAQAVKGMGDAALGGAGKVDKLAQLMAKLTPEGRDFVRFLHGEFVPAWRPLKELAQAELLGPLTDGMRRVIGLQPTITTGVGQMAGELGRLALEAGKVTEQPAFRRQLGDIMESNARSVGSFGRAGLSGMEMLVDLGAASNPVVERFSRLAEYSSQAFESFILGKASTGELTGYLQAMGDRLGEVVDWAGQVIGGVWDLSQGLAPLGSTILTITGNVAEFLGWAAQLNPTMTSWVVGLALAAGGFVKLATAITAMRVGTTIASVTSLAGGVRTLLTPSLLVGTTAMTGLMTGTSAMAQRMGMGSAAANTLGARVATTASTLPLLGLAIAAVVIGHDALTTSASEAANALLQGGGAAGKMRAELAQNDATMARNREWMPGWLADLEEWTRGTVGVMTTTEQANAELERQIATMGPLEAAQARATLAQSAYETALRNTGPASAETGLALQQLRDRTKDVEIAQIAAREKVDYATAAIIYQRDTILGTLSADLRKRQAVMQLKDAQKDYGDAVAQHGAQSDVAVKAGLQLESVQQQVAAAAKEGKDGVVGYGRAVGDMVVQTKGPLTESLTQMVSHMSAAELSAARATVTVDGAGQAVARFPGGKEVRLTAEASQAVVTVQQTKALIDLTRGTIGVDADPGLGVAKVGGFKLQTDATTGVVRIDGNISPADQQRLGIKAKTDGTEGTIWINGNPVRADGKLDGMRVKVDRTTGVMTIDGDPARANDASRVAHDAAGRPVVFPVGANYADAQRASEGFWARQWREIGEISRSVDRFFGVDPNTGAIGRARGSIDRRGAVGMAGGGMRTMRSGVATTVPRNTPTLIGDNRSVTESYIPHDDSARSLAILRETARAMGYAAVPLDAVAMASGGTLARGAGSAGASPPSASSSAGSARQPEVAGAVVGAAMDPQQQDAAAAGMEAVTVAATEQAAALLGVLVPALDAAQLAHGELQGTEALTRLSQQQTTTQTQTGATLMSAAVAAMSLASQAQHAALRGTQAATRGSTVQTQLQTQGSHAAMTGSTLAMVATTAAQHAALRFAQQVTQQSTALTAAVTGARHGDMMASAGQMSVVTQGHLAGVRGGQGVTQQATVAFADAWRAQLARTQPDSANPLRWVINFPMAGITAAWNNLDRQFALGKQVAPYRPGFKTGGVAGAEGVRPGYSPGRDTHDISVGGGEAIMRPEWTRVMGSSYVDQANLAARRGGSAGVAQFLRSTGTTDQQAEARTKLGLMRRYRLDGYAYGGVAPHVAAAGDEVTRVVGRMPGGIGGKAGRSNSSDHPSGYALDYMSMGDTALGNRVAGHLQANAERLAVKYLIWQQKINQGRGWVGMEDRGSPTANHRDHVHASFEGGPLGGRWGDGPVGGAAAFFDPTPMIDAAFAPVYRQIADVPKFFGPSAQVGRDQGVAKFSADKVRALALEKAMASVGSMDVSGISGPVVAQVRQVAARYGWAQGAPWDQGIFPLVAKESSWNPAAANRSSSARGLFQKMTSIHGPIEPTPAGQAAWGLNYIKGRYGDPVRAWAFHRSHNYYDEGGVASGTGVLPKGTPKPERVLSPRQTDRFDELVAGALSSVRATGQVSLLNGDTLAQIRAAGGGGDAAADEVAALRVDVRDLMGQIIRLSRDLASRETINVYPSQGMDEEQVARRVETRRELTAGALG